MSAYTADLDKRHTPIIAVTNENRTGANRERRPIDQSCYELDALFTAANQIEAALLRERQTSAKLQEQLSTLQSEYAQDSKCLQNELRSSLTREADLKARLTLLQQNEKQHQDAEKTLRERLTAVEQENKTLRETLQRTRAENTYELQQTKFELEMSETGISFAKQQIKALQQEIDKLNSRLLSSRNETDREKREIINRESQLKEMIKSYDARYRAHVEDAANLKAELSRYKSAWSEAAASKQKIDQLLMQKSDLEGRLRAIEREKQSFLNTRSTESMKQQELERELENERNEKHMLLNCLKSAEYKIADSEARLAEASSETERLANTPMASAHNLSRRRPLLRG